jgi:hypothetical protein
MKNVLDEAIRLALSKKKKPKGVKPHQVANKSHKI